MVDWKQWFDEVKDVVLLVLGHAATGFGSAFLYELTQLLVNGVTGWQALLQGAFIGGSIGFFRVMIEELEKLKKPLPAVAAAAPVPGKKVKAPAVPVPVEPKKREFKKYFGF